MNLLGNSVALAAKEAEKEGLLKKTEVFGETTEAAKKIAQQGVVVTQPPVVDQAKELIKEGPKMVNFFNENSIQLGASSSPFH